MPKHRFDQHEHFDQTEVQAACAFMAKQGVEFKEDAGLWTAKQLDYVRAQVYESKPQTLGGLALVPPSSDAPEWAETISSVSYDSVGMAKIVANYADDLPRADVKGVERIVKVHTVGDSYGYNVQELRVSAAMGTQLPTRKANAARRAVDLKLNRISLVGDADYGIYGITNHPNMPVVSGLNGDWADSGTTAEQIVADFDTMVQAVRTQSKGVHYPNKAAVASSAWAAAESKVLTGNAGKSAADRIREKYPRIAIVDMPELDASVADGIADNMIIVGEFTTENVVNDVPMQFNQLPAQARNLEFVVPCMARAAGVSLFYPLAFAKATGL